MKKILLHGTSIKFIVKLTKLMYNDIKHDKFFVPDGYGNKDVYVINSVNGTRADIINKHLPSNHFCKRRAPEGKEKGNEDVKEWINTIREILGYRLIKKWKSIVKFLGVVFVLTPFFYNWILGKYSYTADNRITTYQQGNILSITFQPCKKTSHDISKSFWSSKAKKTISISSLSLLLL